MVTAVAQAGDGWTVADVITAPGQEGAVRRCPDCGAAATEVKEMVITTPRDVSVGDRQILLRWHKRRWICSNEDCERKTFTESLPAVPARARLTARLRTRLGEAVGDDLMPAGTASRTAPPPGPSPPTPTPSSPIWTNSKNRARPPESTSSAAAPPDPAAARSGSPTWWT